VFKKLRDSSDCGSYMKAGAMETQGLFPRDRNLHGKGLQISVHKEVLVYSIPEWLDSLRS
jgi:hypothetical protein